MVLKYFFYGKEERKKEANANRIVDIDAQTINNLMNANMLSFLFSLIGNQSKFCFY